MADYAIPDTVDEHIRRLDGERWFESQKVERELRCSHGKELLFQEIGNWAYFRCAYCGRVRDSADGDA